MLTDDRLYLLVVIVGVKRSTGATHRRVGGHQFRRPNQYSVCVHMAPQYICVTIIQLILHPASTLKTSPVILRASSPSKKTAARATSSASIKSSESGCLVLMNSSRSGFCRARWLIGVRVSAGAIALTRILLGA